MICPYCHVEYTEEHPCFCQPAASRMPVVTGESRSEEERWRALRPTGLDNPFWKPEPSSSPLSARGRSMPGPQA